MYQLAQVEMSKKGERVFVSAPTHPVIAQLIFAATVRGFQDAGYVRSNDEVDKPISGVEILRCGSETVAFQVVSHE